MEALSDTFAIPAAPAISVADWRDWLALLKPRVMGLVVFTGWIGLVLAPGHLNPVLAFTAILCIAIGAGAAGCLNMWYERDIDALMRRTAKRPVPAGRIAPADALGFGITLAAASVLVMALATNLVAAALLAASIAFYVVVYTVWLKRITPQNIVIGGAAGAVPPIIGWAAVTGSVGVMPLLMFAIVFLWTPPHFWSMALYSAVDYGRAGVPMLPVVAGHRRTRREIMIYTVLLVPVSVAPWLLGDAGAIYGIAALVLGLGFLVGSFRVLRDQADAAGTTAQANLPARQNFRYSLAYLALLFLALGIDRVVL